MQENIHKNWRNRLNFKALLLLPLAVMLNSCVMQMGGTYSETDGVYYNPDTDTFPEGYVMNEGNQVGNYYDYQDQTSIQKSLENQSMKNNRFDGWSTQTTSDSDWGSFAGTELNYNSYGGFGYGGFGYGGYYGLGYGGFGYGGYGGFYNPYSFYGGFSPYGFGYGGFYNPYYGGFGSYYGGGYGGYYGGGYGGYYGGGYGNYYGGYGNGYYGNNYNVVPYKRSGENGGGLRNANGQSTSGRNLSSDRNYTVRSRDNGFRGTNDNSRSARQNDGMRSRNNGFSETRNSNQRGYRPSYNDQSTRSRSYDNQRSQPSFSTPRDTGGGFRGNSGSSGGGFRGGSSSGGGGRSSGGGGFRR